MLGVEQAIDVRRRDARHIGERDQHRFDAVAACRLHAELAESDLTVKIARTRTGFKLTTRGASHVVRVLPTGVAAFAHHLIEKVPPDLSKFLIAPMPGLLVRLDVGVGDAVQLGQPLAVVEAMKMENILRAEKAATVKAVEVKAGDSLAVDQVILEME